MNTVLLNKLHTRINGYNLKYLLNMTILAWTIPSLTSFSPPPIQLTSIGMCSLEVFE